MNLDSHDFSELRKLLTIKRHEQPPPRYFNDFSDRVMRRLEELENQKNQSWWRRLVWDFDFKPAYVYATGLMVCGVLSLGLVASEPDSSFASASNFGMDGSGVMVLPDQAPVAPPEHVRASTEPVITVVGTPFQQFAPSVHRLNL